LLDVSNALSVHIDEIIIYSIVKGSTIITGAAPGGFTADDATSGSSSYNNRWQ
jgi:hypothetical protein